MNVYICSECNGVVLNLCGNHIDNNNNDNCYTRTRGRFIWLAVSANEYNTNYLQWINLLSNANRLNNHFHLNEVSTIFTWKQVLVQGYLQNIT